MPTRTAVAPSRTKRIKLAVWTPDGPAGPGDLPTFTRSFIDALQSAAPGSALTVYSPGYVPSPPNGDIPPAGLEFRGAGKWPAFLRGAVLFVRLLLGSVRHRPGLVVLTHVRFAPSARLLRKILRIPFAVIAHGPEILDEPGSRSVLALADADLVLTESTYCRDHIRDVLSLPKEKTGVLHAPFAHERFLPGAKPPYLLSRYEIGSEQPLVLAVTRAGSTENLHACEQVIESLPIIRETLPDVHCLVCGHLRGDEIEKVRAMLRYFHLEDCVTLADAFPEDERCDHYNLADLVVLPSKGEGFATVLLEAMACGTPVLAGNKDGAVDSLLDGSLGVLVDPESPGQIGEAATKILTGSGELPLLYRPREMRKRVINEFGFDHFVEDLVSHFDHLGIELSPAPPAEPHDAPTPQTDPTPART